MPRRRFAVALLAPPAQAMELDALRRAAGVAEPFHVPPHITLVPPINVAGTDVDDALAVIRRVARSRRRLELGIGPVATFLPETPTLHLDVGGPDLDALRATRGALRSGPFDRPDVWPFHPHVTIREQAAPELIHAGLAALAAFEQRWTLGAVHLLEQRRGDPAHGEHGRAPWIPVHEEPFGPPAVVGRGGVELHLRTVGMLDPVVAPLVGRPASVPPVVPGRVPLVVVAELPGDPAAVGVAAGRVDEGGSADLDRVVVDAAHRGRGIGPHLVREWCSRAAARGAEVAIARADDGSGFLPALGFSPLGDLLVRRL